MRGRLERRARSANSLGLLTRQGIAVHLVPLTGAEEGRTRDEFEAGAPAKCRRLERCLADVTSSLTSGDRSDAPKSAKEKASRAKRAVCSRTGTVQLQGVESRFLIVDEHPLQR